MGGSVALPLVVEVAFGAEPLDTGTLTWTDISAYVKRSAGIDFSRGWDTEAAEPLAGRLTFTVNNDDGRFTPGETGAFGEVRNRLPVRVSRSGVGVLWTGLVESWRVTWENGVRSQVQVTAVDRWAAIRRLTFDGKFVERVVVDQGPTDFWTLTADKTTQDRAEPTIGSNLLATKIAGSRALLAPDQANPQTWRTATPDEVPTVGAATYSEIYPATFIAGEASLLPTGAASVAFSASGWVREGRIGLNAPTILPTDAVALQVWSGTAYLSLARTAGAGAENYKTAAAGSGWHHVALTCSVNGSGACTLNFYLDGASIGTDTTWATGGWTVATPWVRFDALSGGAVAYAALWDRALTGAEVLAQYQAGTTAGVAGETADVRAARLLTYAVAVPTLTTTGTFTATMSVQDLAGKSLGDALMECAAAEGGTLHMGTDGWPVLTSRSWRTGAALAFSISAHALSSDVSWTLDDQQLCNSASVERMAGDASAGTVSARNDASIATYGEQSASLQLWLHTDAQAIERANAEANMFAVAMPRSADLSVDVLTRQATIPAATVLGAQIGDRVEVTDMPSQAPSETHFYIDSITDRVTATEWTRTFSVSPRLDFWTLQDATFGVIDSVFVLAY